MHDRDVGGGPEPRTQFAGEPFVDLDGDHAIGAKRERRGQAAEPGPDLEHELTGADPGLRDELRCDRVATKEMLSASRSAARAPARVRRAHGPSP